MRTPMTPSSLKPPRRQGPDEGVWGGGGYLRTLMTPSSLKPPRRQGPDEGVGGGMGDLRTPMTPSRDWDMAAQQVSAGRV